MYIFSGPECPFIDNYMRKAEWRTQVWHVATCINKSWGEYMHRQ